MVIFGFLNGIILQPIILSMMGPVYDDDDENISNEIGYSEANDKTNEEYEKAVSE